MLKNKTLAIGLLTTNQTVGGSTPSGRDIIVYKSTGYGAKLGRFVCGCLIGIKISILLDKCRLFYTFIWTANSCANTCRSLLKLIVPWSSWRTIELCPSGWESWGLVTTCYKRCLSRGFIVPTATKPPNMGYFYLLPWWEHVSVCQWGWSQSPCCGNFGRVARNTEMQRSKWQSGTTTVQRQNGIRHTN